MASLNEAFNSYVPEDKRLQVKSNYQPVFGYICAVCDGCLNYHNSIQHRNRHSFVKGKYRELLPCERGPFKDGISFLN